MILTMALRYCLSPMILVDSTMSLPAKNKTKVSLKHFFNNNSFDKVIKTMLRERNEKIGEVF